MRQRSYARRRLFVPKTKQQADKHYGPAAMDPVDEMDASELKRLCVEKCQELQISSEEIKEIERATVGQHDNDLYNIYRKDRLTASQFGVVSLHDCALFSTKILYFI